jgi:hypothetical protein
MNGRLLERKRFGYLFKDGAREPVLAALKAYQNPDGGFGNALEPDKRCTNSQPVDQEVAFSVLDEIGFDPAVTQQVCQFLASVSTEEGGVPFVLPSVASAPRAPWWNTTDNPPASINPTGSVLGYLYKHRMQHSWMARATDFCWRKVDAMHAVEPHDLLCAFRFLAYVPDRARATQQYQRLGDELLQSGFVSTDFDSNSYSFRPLDWAPTPDSLCRPLFGDEMIAANLDALTARQQQDGGWSIMWPPVSPACELEYRGMMTINALKTLVAYGRVTLPKR